MILLDTDVWSALNRPAQYPKVVRWIEDHASQIWLSVIVIAEIRFGIQNPNAASRRIALERWLADLELGYRDRTLVFDAPAAHRFGALVGRRELERQETKLLELQIAAQALSRDCAVATWNTGDFQWTGVQVIDPWQA